MAVSYLAVRKTGRRGNFNALQIADRWQRISTASSVLSPHRHFGLAESNFEQVEPCIPRAHSFVAIRQGATVEADRSAFFSSDQTALRAILRIGYGFTYPEAIVKVTFQRPLLTP